MSVISNVNTSLIAHILGIYVFFLSCSVFQEKITTTVYNGEKYSSILFPTILQSLGGALTSYIFMRNNSKQRHLNRPNLLLLYMYCAILSILSSTLANRSLKYLSYPALIIAKSCKLIPIALVNFIVYRKRLDTTKYMSVIFTSLSVFLFNYLGKADTANDPYSLTGMYILLINLLLDGVINTLQDYIFKTFNVTSFHMMFYLNASRLVIATISILVSDNLTYSLVFISKSPTILLDLVFSAALNILGQIIIYSMLEHHGSMALATVNVTRKIFSILLSLLIFGHKIEFAQWLCVLGVLFSISIEMFDNKEKIKTT